MDPDPGCDEAAVRRLISEQDGVVARRQLVTLGCGEVDLRRRLRRGELVVVHPGVYVDHSGPPTRAQREWAAVLFHWPAALHRESALRAHGMTRDRAADGDRIHVLVAAAQRRTALPGVVAERVRDADRWIHWHRSPPRARVEFALVKVASGRDRAGAGAVLSDAVQQGLTTPARILDVLDSLNRVPGRAFLREVLADVASGARSVLEHRYLTRVERAHGLPAGERQVRAQGASGAVYRDVRYPGQRTLVELDGAFGHRDATDRWSDLERDVSAVVDGQLTLRPGWSQVLEPCRLAGIVGALLRARGWEGVPTPCGPDCTLDRGVLLSPGGSTTPRSA